MTYSDHFFASEKQGQEKVNINLINDYQGNETFEKAGQIVSKKSIRRFD